MNRLCNPVKAGFAALNFHFQMSTWTTLALASGRSGSRKPIFL
jgi:hypothetical protein